MQHHQLDDLPNPNTSTSDPPIVLHVEDDHDFSAALRFRLEAHGVAVIRSEDGDNGIRRLLERKVDAVLLDYELPNRNGDEVIKSIRKIDALRELPIIVITGRNDNELRIRMSDLGASGFLTKPLRFSELRSQLARFIDILPCCT